MALRIQLQIANMAQSGFLSKEPNFEQNSLLGIPYSLLGLCIVCRGFVKSFGASPLPPGSKNVPKM